MTLNWETGLHKSRDNDQQVEYIFRHKTMVQILLKIVLFAVTIYIDQFILIHKPSYLRLIGNVSLLMVNYLIPIFKQESVLFIKTIGLQLVESNGIFQSNVSHKFIPSNDIVDIIINEGFKGLQVIYYLAVLVEDGEKLDIILPNANLRLNDLIQIRKDLRKKLITTSQQDTSQIP